MQPLINKTALGDRFGWDVLLEDIRRRLKCQKCGRPADRLMLGHEQAAVPEALGFKSGLAWANMSMYGCTS